MTAVFFIVKLLATFLLNADLTIACWRNLEEITWKKGIETPKAQGPLSENKHVLDDN
jgi:hypothetical protein